MFSVILLLFSVFFYTDIPSMHFSLPACIFAMHRDTLPSSVVVNVVWGFHTQFSWSLCLYETL